MSVSWIKFIFQSEFTLKFFSLMLGSCLSQDPLEQRLSPWRVILVRTVILDLKKENLALGESQEIPIFFPPLFIGIHRSGSHIQVFLKGSDYFGLSQMLMS